MNISRRDLLASTTYYTCKLRNGGILIRESPCPAGAETFSSEEVEEKPAAVEEPQPPAAGVEPGAAPAASAEDGDAVRDEPFVDPSFESGFFSLVILRARLMKVVVSLQALKNSVMVYYMENGAVAARVKAGFLDKTWYVASRNDLAPLP